MTAAPSRWFPSRREFLGVAFLAAGATTLPRVLVAAEPQSEHDEAASHPLDPLSIAEMERVVKILRTDKNLGDSWRFVSAVLQEPDKGIARAWGPGQPVPRRAFVVLLDTAQ